MGIFFSVHRHANRGHRASTAAGFARLGLGTQAASLPSPAALSGTPLHMQFSDHARITRSRRVADTYRLAACAPKAPLRAYPRSTTSATTGLAILVIH